MSLATALLGRGPNGFGASSTAEEVTEGANLSGRTYLITGAGSGIGRESARVLASRGARVLAMGRERERVAHALSGLSGQLVPVQGDLADLASLDSLVHALDQEKLDGILANAGIMGMPQLTLVEGYEAHFFTNHIGHFHLVTSLLPRLEPGGRVVMVSSSMHKRSERGGINFDNLRGEKRYKAYEAYGRSKLCNLLFARELARRSGERFDVHAVHPGVIKTGIVRHMPAVLGKAMAAVSPLFFKTVGQGAATQCHVLTAESPAEQSGQFFADCNLKRSAKVGRDQGLATQLWERSEEIVAECRARIPA